MSLSRLGLNVEAIRSRMAQLRRELELTPADAAGSLHEHPDAIATAVEEVDVLLEELESASVRADEERRKYRDLFERAPDPYLVTGLDGIILEANHAAVALFQTPLDNLLGKPLLTLIAREDQRVFRRYLSLRRDEIRDLTIRVQPRRGEPIEVSITLSAVRTAGEHAGWRWLLRDVTELRRAAEVEALYRMTHVLESSLDAQVILDQSLPAILSGANAAAAEAWLYDPATNTAELKARAGGAETPLFAQERLALGEGLPGIALETLLPVSSAEVGPGEARLGPRILDSGLEHIEAYPLVFQNKRLGVLCVAFQAPMGPAQADRLVARMAGELAIALKNAELFRQEQAARAEAEATRAALEASERRLATESRQLQAILDASAIGIFAVSAEERILFINAEMRHLLGIQEDGIQENADRSLRELHRRAPLSRLDGAPYALEERPIMRALKNGENILAEEARLEAGDGSPVLAMLSARPIYAEDGSIVGAVGMTQDISAMEGVEKQRNEFMSLMGHELRSPLSSIKGAAVMALQSQGTLDTHEARDLFRVVDEQVDRLTTLVNNLVDMTYIETGYLGLNTEALDLREVMDEAVLAFRDRRSGQAVEVILPEALPPVEADRYRISQVVANLLEHAARFSSPEAPVTIAAEAPSGNGSHVTIKVHDQGKGVPPDKLALLFRKFAHLDADERVDLGGAGLGLAIAKGIVEAHGGRIAAESAGEGTTISFTIPVAAVSALLSAPTPVPAPTPLSASGEGPGVRSPSLLGAPGSSPATPQPPEPVERVRRRGDQKQVLVIDDDHHLLRFLRRFLSEAGYQVSVTTDPGKTSYLIEMEEPDLVLLDLTFPGASGYDLLGRIREFSNVPVIFLTGKSSEEDVVKALKMGADDYITKPFASSELLARIETALRKGARHPEQADVRPPYEVDWLAVNFAERRVLVEGAEVSLTATEYKLLYEMAANAGRVMTYDQLLRNVWGIEYAGETNLVRSFILSLRRKLKDDGKQPRLIRTERGVGYRMPKGRD